MQLIIYAVLIFSVAIIAGLIAVMVVDVNKKFLTLFLAFSGAYLFSITVVHILPELFDTSDNVTIAGIFVLVGFFLQHILEYFTSGVEHGHMHEKHHHRNHSSYVWSIVLALTIHSLLEGTVLTDQHGDGIFLGVLIHKAPAAFALVSVLMCEIKSKFKIAVFLIVFAIASPTGMALSYLISPDSVQPILLGIVAGSFLQISTTIVFEGSSDHKFNLTKLFSSLMGAFLAILSELLFL